jgi:hypothetical protein
MVNVNNELIAKIRPVILAGFGAASLACVRSWGKHGFTVGMICIKYQGAHSPSSRFLKEFTMLPIEKLYTEEGIRIIGTFLKQFCASGIICVTEKVACWLNDHRQALPAEVGVWLPENKTINDLLSKQKQIEIARKVGFGVLPTYLVHPDIKVANDIPYKHFPLCLKPSGPETVIPAFKVHLVYSTDELNKFINNSLKNIEQPIIGQPFRHLPNLVVHGVRTLSGESIGLQAFLVERKFEGVTLTIRPAGLGKELRDKCIRFTDTFNVTGNYHFEFLIDKKDGSVSFLELNSRFGGTTAKVYACGYDEPLLALQAYGVIPVNHYPKTINRNSASQNRQTAASSYPLSTIEYGTLANTVVSSRWALLKYLRYTLQDKLTPFDYPTETKLIRIVKILHAFFRYKDDVLSFQDIRGSLAFYRGIFASILKKHIPLRASDSQGRGV